MCRQHALAGIAVAVIVQLGIAPLGAGAEDRLPPYLEPTVTPTQALRPWSIADITEVRRVTGTAISNKTRAFAFIVKQGFLDSDEIRYGLYVATPGTSEAKRIKEADYINELSWDQNTDSWTVLADFGAGIQLYEVDSSGRDRPLVVNPKTVVVGASESVVDADAQQGPRKTGIASYEWAPDGQSLWYSTYRLRDPADRAALLQRGVTFDDREMYIHTFFNDSTVVLGVELHVLTNKGKSDRMLTFVPAGSRVGILFNRTRGSAFWQADSRHIHCFMRLSKQDGSVDISKWSIDAESGAISRFSAGGFYELADFIPAPDRVGDLSVQMAGRSHRLIGTAVGGEPPHDFGRVEFNALGGDYEPGAWFDPHAKRLILAVDYGDRWGLATFPDSLIGNAWSHVPENLSHCTFTMEGDAGICVRESQTLAPQIVEVSPISGEIKTLVQVNPDYIGIQALRVVHNEWINRYGNSNDGYVTYPRSYVPGKPYPTIVITHAHGARNQFAEESFQWEFPVQALAEHGYLVMSVNEPQVTAQARSATETRIGVHVRRGTTQIAFYQALNPVSSIEDALTSEIRLGLADPSRTGIAGYSRGAEIVEWTMTQSRLFHAAVEGDAGGFLSGHYGLAQIPLRLYYRQLYGGSPFNPKVLAAHLRLSPSFRSREFAGPFLQLFAQSSAISALELHSLLRDENIPTELDFFPQESHIFWEPRHRAAAMQDTIDWFDYWLLGKRSDDDQSRSQYARWDAMAEAWKHNARH
jgi:dipeptidyl aminopeptidase/acylaminoacyl peptidase